MLNLQGKRKYLQLGAGLVPAAAMAVTRSQRAGASRSATLDREIDLQSHTGHMLYARLRFTRVTEYRSELRFIHLRIFFLMEHASMHTAEVATEVTRRRRARENQAWNCTDPLGCASSRAPSTSFCLIA